MTATVPKSASPRSFVVWGTAASLGLFGLLRLPWTEAHLLLPLTRAQGGLASALVGAPTRAVEVTLACSGAEILALCLGAIGVYPVAWRARAVGALGGVTLILGLNTLRIGTLGRAAASPASFEVLHVIIWPSLLLLAVAGYVLLWMRHVDRCGRVSSIARPKPTRRFVVLTAIFLLIFVATAPVYLQSAGVLAIGAVIAHAAATLLTTIGLSAHAVSNVLWTARGGVLVTQECLATPLIPVYLAAVFSYSTTWRQTVTGLLAALPVFLILGVLRLLVVVVPDMRAEPLFLVHAFYQVLAGALAVCIAAWWRHPQDRPLARALAGIGIGILFIWLAGPTYSRIIGLAGSAARADPQGALAFLVPFQAGLFVALSTSVWTRQSSLRLVAGMAILVISQVVTLWTLAIWCTLDLTSHVRDVRAWSVIGPILILATVITRARLR